MVVRRQAPEVREIITGQVDPQHAWGELNDARDRQKSPLQFMTDTLDARCGRYGC
ncbi:hypothetical protein ABIE78_004226 [Sinorhizobium fredii]